MNFNRGEFGDLNLRNEKLNRKLGVKIEGSDSTAILGLLTLISQNYEVIRMSKLIFNDRDSGFHVFIDLDGRKEEL